MFDAHQKDRWDHTAQMLAAWSSNAPNPADLNPYRRNERRERRRRTMPPVELYAMQKAIVERNRRRAAME